MSVHGSTGSPRTDHRTLKFNELAVRPELVEGRAANYDTVSKGKGEGACLPKPRRRQGDGVNCNRPDEQEDTVGQAATSPAANINGKKVHHVLTYPIAKRAAVIPE